MIAPKTITDLSLNQLKIMFDGQISPRRLGCVELKYDLIKYLWKEDKIDFCYLQKYKVNNLEEIVRHDDAFSSYLLSGNSSRCTGENEYAKQRESDDRQQIAQSNCYTKETVEERFARKKFQIHSLIRSDIGSKWYELGRHLNIKHGKLDSIEHEHKEIARKVDEIFKIFDEHHRDEFSYVDDLSNALQASRRNDLSKKIREIMRK